MKQYFPDHPAKTYTIDLLFGSNYLVEYLHSSDQIVVPDYPHHEPATFKLNVNSSMLSYNHTAKYNFRKLDVQKLNTYLSNISWDNVLKLDTLDVNKSIELFYEILHIAIEFSVPKLGLYRRLFPNWFTEELKNSIFSKKVLHKIWKVTGNIDDFIKFKQARANCIKLMRAAHKEHTYQVQLAATRNLNSFWRFINSKRIDNSIPVEMFLEDTNANNGRDIAALFSRHFKSSFQSNNYNSSSLITELHNHHSESINSEWLCSQDTLDISLNDVIAAINALKNSYYCAPDGVPAVVIKKCAPFIAYPLLLLFSKSLEVGTFPEKWKFSFVNPYIQERRQTICKQL